MFTPNEKNYKPPFITETDEPTWNDCTVASTLMATAAATLGRTVMGDDWRPLNATGLKKRREAIRNQIPGDTDVGGTSMADMRTAFGAFYPWLPDLKSAYFDVQQNTWSQTVDKLSSGWVAVLQGNPINVKNVNSKLRRWTNNDRYDHAIYADRARKNADGTTDIFIMDPLGRGDYDGEWVPAVDVKQFTGVQDGYVKANMFERGEWSAENLANANLKEALSITKRKLAASNASVATYTAQVAALKEQLKNVVTDQTLKDQLKVAQDALAKAQAQYDKAKTTVDTFKAAWDSATAS